MQIVLCLLAQVLRYRSDICRHSNNSVQLPQGAVKVIKSNLYRLTRATWILSSEMTSIKKSWIHHFQWTSFCSPPLFWGGSIYLRDSLTWANKSALLNSTSSKWPFDPLKHILIFLSQSWWCCRSIQPRRKTKQVKACTALSSASLVSGFFLAVWFSQRPPRRLSCFPHM